MNASLFAPEEIHTADVIVVGAGVAGCTAALHAGDRDVVVLGKTGAANAGSSVHAQGGIAAALDPDDTPRLHAEDTVRAGAGLCDPEVVQRVTAEGPRRIAELVAWGANLDCDQNGHVALGREGAHSRNRVAHAAGDATGRELVRVLSEAVEKASNIARVDNVLALDLVRHRGAVAGLAAIDRDGRHILYAAPEVVLATGGMGALWERTTNPPESGGDGLAIALRAGAAAADLEFVQFHPTALAVEGQRLPLLTEALRGEGAVLIDGCGRRFMPAEHPDAELAPRDVVARAIWRLVRRGSAVFLDATVIGAGIGERFPTVTALCREHGLDPSRDPLPVTPAAHYHMGGIVVDGDGRTTVPGLWACGEAARTGLHGANRLASNSLLEAVVYGAAVGRAIARGDNRRIHPVRFHNAVQLARIPVAATPWQEDASAEGREIDIRLRHAMWQGAGLVRDARGLRAALDDVFSLRRRLGEARSEVANRLLAAEAVLRTALKRTESRGAHFRSDFPRPSDCWLQPLFFMGKAAIAPKPLVPVTASG